MTDDNTPVKQGEAQHWLDLLDKARVEFDAWQSVSDNIDRAYADLAQLRNMGRDREFQLFWSNIQIIGPSIYARPPIPVVTPKFKDRRPLYRTASEFLERCQIISFDQADIDQHMIELRDDLSIAGRGVAWVRYESDDDGERVCYEHLDRKDFLHDPARKWCEVDWVARRGWMSRDDMTERFGAEIAGDVTYALDRDEGARRLSRSNEKCGVWEIWSKSSNRVVWVVEGYPKTLEEDEPHLELAGFFPCPRPAYATVQRRSLIPVPDMLLYKDQLEEVNDLTRRIHALSESIRVRGFYAGGGDIGEAIERAIKMTDDDQILIPVPAMQQLMQGGGDPIMWMPLEMVAQTITGLIDLRRQVIDDVYQIMGMSDIMRGSTDASETLGAQRLKQQNSSFRVRDKQNELVRIARDLVRLGAEIMAEKFDRDTLIDMAQMDLPTDGDLKRQIKGIEASLKEQIGAIADQAEQQPDADPAQIQQQIQQITQQHQQQVQQASQQVTVEQVMEFLKDEKLRPFVLDIETDSTVYPDEQAEKAARTEFMGAFSGAMQSLAPMFAMGPEAISVAGGVFKFALAPYRVGRELEGLIDDFVDQGPQIAERLQQQGSEGEDDGLAAAQMKLAEAEVGKAQAGIAKVQADTEKSRMEMQLRQAEAQAKAQADQQKIGLEFEKTKGTIAETEARIRKVEAEIAKMGVDASNQTRTQDREDVKAQADIQSRQVDQALAVEGSQRAAVESDRNAKMSERQQAFNEQRGMDE